MKTTQELTDERMQEILNRVIKHKFYPFVATSQEGSSNFMCIALSTARDQGVVDGVEYLFAKVEIIRYLEGENSLRRHLVQQGFPSEIEDRIKIYQDWKNRPFPKPIKFSGFE